MTDFTEEIKTTIDWTDCDVTEMTFKMMGNLTFIELGNQTFATWLRKFSEPDWIEEEKGVISWNKEVKPTTNWDKEIKGTINWNEEIKGE